MQDYCIHHEISIRPLSGTPHDFEKYHALMACLISAQASIKGISCGHKNFKQLPLELESVG